MEPARKIQYASAVCLIISSIALAAYQVVDIKDVANGLLLYIAQAFLLAGSIFGLDYYVKRITSFVNGKRTGTNAGNPQQ